MSKTPDYWDFCQNLSCKTPAQVQAFFEEICAQDWRPDLVMLADVLADHVLVTDLAQRNVLQQVAKRAMEHEGAKTNAYHNQAHTAHVAILSAYLACQQKQIVLDTHECALLLIAAFAHDVDHPGQGNPPHNPFLNEKNSVQGIMNLLQELSADDQQKIETMILATSPNEPHQDLKKILSTRQTRFKELGLLTGDRRLFEMTAILSDADIMLSSGMGEAVQAEMSRRFSDETYASSGKRIDFNSASSRWSFFEKIVGFDGYLSQSGQECFLDSYLAFKKATRTKLDLAF